MTGALQALEDLPEFASDLSKDLARTNRDLLDFGWSRLLTRQQLFPETLLLAPLDLTLRFWIAKETNGQIFFFFRQQRFEVVIDAKAQIKIGLAPRSINLRRPTSREAHYHLSVPRVIVPDLTAADLTRFTNLITDPRPSKENTVLFRIGPQHDRVLAIVLDRVTRSTPDVRFQYTQPSGKARILESSNGKWLLAPFLALLQALADWKTGTSQTYQTLSLTISREKGRSDVARILGILPATYRQINLNLDEFNHAFPEGSLQDELLPGLQTETFTARISLRLNPEGNLSTKNDDRVFHLTVKVNMVLEESGPTPYVTLAIPDFLAASDLGPVLLAPFLEDDGFDELFAKLKGPDLGFSAKDLQSFLKNAERKAIIFRIDRKKSKEGEKFIKRSTNVFVLRSTIADTEQTLIFRATLLSQGKLHKGHSRKLVRKSVKVLFFGVPKPDSVGLNQETIDYFTRLANTVRRLLGVVL